MLVIEQLHRAHVVLKKQQTKHRNGTNEFTQYVHVNIKIVCHNKTPRDWHGPRGGLTTRAALLDTANGVTNANCGATTLWLMCLAKVMEFF